MQAYFDILIVGFKKPGMSKMDTPSRTNYPSSMETPHIGWLFDECLDKSNIDDVFDGVVLENCDHRIALYLLFVNIILLHLCKGFFEFVSLAD